MPSPPNRKRSVPGESHRILLGFLTLVPSLAVLAILVALLAGFHPRMLPAGPDLEQLKPSFALLAGVKVLLIGLAIYYTVHVIGSDQVAQERKGLWVVGFFLFGFLVMPRYWWKFIRPRSGD